MEAEELEVEKARAQARRAGAVCAALEQATSSVDAAVAEVERKWAYAAAPGSLVGLVSQLVEMRDWLAILADRASDVSWGLPPRPISRPRVFTERQIGDAVNWLEGAMKSNPSVGLWALFTFLDGRAGVSSQAGGETVDDGSEVSDGATSVVADVFGMPVRVRDRGNGAVDVFLAGVRAGRMTAGEAGCWSFTPAAFPAGRCPMVLDPTGLRCKGPLFHNGPHVFDLGD